MLEVSAYRYVCICMVIKLHASNYRVVTYIYNNLQRWNLHHCLPHELANPFMYSSCLKFIDKISSKEIVILSNSEKYVILTDVDKCSLLCNTEIYGKLLTYLDYSHDSKQDGTLLFSITSLFS